MAETYKWKVLNQTVQRLSDGACIPNYPGNIDWQAFQTWTMGGGVAADADPPPSAADILAADRAGAIVELADSSANAKLMRGILLLAMNEINLLREWIESFKTATAAASSLANLQSRIAALPAMPDRTATQLKTAVQAIINAGTAD